MAATVPATYDNSNIDLQPDLVDSDQDAEGDEDVDLYPQAQPPEYHQRRNAGDSPTLGKDVEAIIASELNIHEVRMHSEREEEERETLEKSDVGNGDGEVVGAVKFPDGDRDSDVAFENESSEANGDSDTDSSRDESEVEEEWEAESNDRDEADAEALNPSNCMWVQSFLFQSLAIAKLFPVFVAKTKNTIQARNLKNT
jgi:histone acetyltransferase SAS3